MKIVSIEAFALQIPLAEPYWGSQAWGGRESEADNNDATWHGFPALGRLQPAYDDGICTVVVKVTADGGLVGWGEGGQYGPPEPVAACLQAVLAPQILGLDPCQPVRIQELRSLGYVR